MQPSRKACHGLPCPYCDRKMQLDHLKLEPTRDHVTPKRNGGREIIICCRQCNGIKGHMLPEQWASYMAANSGWWLLSRAERKARARLDHNRANRVYGVPNSKGDVIRKRAPVVVPPELIYGQREREAEEYSRLVF